MTKSILIAVDATERTLDALALGRLLSDATGAPRCSRAFPYPPLEDPTGEEGRRMRGEAPVASSWR